MKEYVGDQLLTLLVGVGIAVCIPRICAPIMTIIFEIVVALSWGYLCRRLLLLLFDVLLGAKTEKVFFSSQVGIEDYEFFRKHFGYEWKFYYGGNSTIVLLVPDVIAQRTPPASIPLSSNQAVRITYYRLSKILKCYDLC